MKSSPTAGGKRNTQTVKDLYAKLTDLHIDTFCSDDWKAFGKVLPKDKHKIGKAYTKHIEGVNLSLRTRNRRIVRRTACFSKKQTNHDNAMKLVHVQFKFYNRSMYLCLV